MQTGNRARIVEETLLAIVDEWQARKDNNPARAVSRACKLIVINNTIREAYPRDRQTSTTGGCGFRCRNFS